MNRATISIINRSSLSIWKIGGIFLGIILFFLISISNLFEIIFNEVGFSDATSYVTTMYNAETENIEKGLLLLSFHV